MINLRPNKITGITLKKLEYDHVNDQLKADFFFTSIEKMDVEQDEIGMPTTWGETSINTAQGFIMDEPTLKLIGELIASLTKQVEDAFFIGEEHGVDRTETNSEHSGE